MEKLVDNVEKQLYKMRDFVLKTKKHDIFFFGNVNQIYKSLRKAQMQI